MEEDLVSLIMMDLERSWGNMAEVKRDGNMILVTTEGYTSKLEVDHNENKIIHHSLVFI